MSAVLASGFSTGIERVLDHVAATAGWRLVDHVPGVALLRRGTSFVVGDMHCPVSSYGVADTTAEERSAIVRASDQAKGHSEALRAALLKAGRCA